MAKILAFEPKGSAQRRAHAADVEADFLGKPQPTGTYDRDADPDPDGSGRVAATRAGYMELQGATKDADCRQVAVPGGVSRDRGCCNLFDPAAGARQFNCGNCVEVEDAAGASAASDSTGDSDAA